MVERKSESRTSLKGLVRRAWNVLVADRRGFIDMDKPIDFRDFVASSARIHSTPHWEPPARLRHKSEWLDYMGCLLMATTVGRAAAAVGNHRNTSFRSRHRFLTLPKTDRLLRLSGIVEADEIYFLESEKAARNFQRDPRKAARPVSVALRKSRYVSWLAATELDERLVSLGETRCRRPHCAAALSLMLAEDVLLVSGGNASYRYFARDAGISHQAINLRKKFD